MSRLLTWVLRLLPILGVLLFLEGAGVFGALPDTWWDSKGFIVNIASGMTAACFGIPIAFFVLQKLLSERAYQSDRQRIARLALDNVQEIKRYIVAKAGIDEKTPGHVYALRDQVFRLRSALEDLAMAHAGPWRAGIRSDQGSSLMQVVSRVTNELLSEERVELTSADAAANARAAADYQRVYIADRLFSSGIAPTSSVDITAIYKAISEPWPSQVLQKALSLQSWAVPPLVNIGHGDRHVTNEAVDMASPQEKLDAIYSLVGEWTNELKIVTSQLTSIIESIKPLEQEIRRLEKITEW